MSVNFEQSVWRLSVRVVSMGEQPERVMLDVECLLVFLFLLFGEVEFGREEGGRALDISR